ncbi:hypothetical protein [Aliikangiella sp. IMCC44632]
MSDKNLAQLSDQISEAHQQIQAQYQNIDPIVGVSRKMRDLGIPADAMTIDCLRSGKRIIIILHDQMPQVVRYQFSFKTAEPDDEFLEIRIDEVTSKVLFNWMRDYFLECD